ncbi:hypothetical protein ABIE37_002348 [Arthrobacter bambusae]|uniref:Histidine kinase n=1 Tax=Arthrobacter bambusae TaxID=1338426 RepID=A0ABV2P707_9MICC
MDRTISRRVILACSIPYPVVHIVLGLANLHRVTSATQTLAAMVICVAVIVVVSISDAQRPLGVASAWAATVGVVIIEVLVKSALPVGTHPGYAAWHCGAIQMLLVTVALRGRKGIAWFGIGVFAVVDFVASLAQQLTLNAALAMVVTPLLWMGMATALSFILRRCARQTAAFTDQEQSSAQILATQNARDLAQNEWMRDLSRATRPMLERIAEGAIGPAEQEACVLLEAELRDQIRGRALATPAVLHAARAARGRGVRVDILDDRATDLPEDLLAEATAQLIGALDRAEDGAVKCRALPEGADVAVTILAFSEDANDEALFMEIRHELNDAASHQLW